MEQCKCEWCEVTDLPEGKDYCDRHLNQIKRLGEVKRSYRDMNDIIVEDDIAKIIIREKLSQEIINEVIIDSDDVEKCKIHKWYINPKGYVKSRVSKEKEIFIHRLINDTPDGFETDHINRNKLDNRKENLRTVTTQENAWNKGTSSATKSGKRGVRKRKEYEGWTAMISKANVQYGLGTYPTFEEAVIAREKAEIELYGRILD